MSNIKIEAEKTRFGKNAQKNESTHKIPLAYICLAKTKLSTKNTTYQNNKTKKHQKKQKHKRKKKKKKQETKKTKNNN